MWKPRLRRVIATPTPPIQHTAYLLIQTDISLDTYTRLVPPDVDLSHKSLKDMYKSFLDWYTNSTNITYFFEYAEKTLPRIKEYKRDNIKFIELKITG